MAVSEGEPGSRLGGAQECDRRQWAGTDAQEILPEHGEELVPLVTGHWDRLYSEPVESPSLEILRNHLDVILCRVLWNDPA